MNEISERLANLEEERERMALVPLKDVRRVRRALKSDAIEEAGMRLRERFVKDADPRFRRF